jgi:vacuolar-type H+-ATPase subunit H
MENLLKQIQDAETAAQAQIAEAKRCAAQNLENARQRNAAAQKESEAQAQTRLRKATAMAHDTGTQAAQDSLRQARSQNELALQAARKRMDSALDFLLQKAMR